MHMCVPVVLNESEHKHTHTHRERERERETIEDIKTNNNKRKHEKPINSTVN